MGKRDKNPQKKILKSMYLKGHGFIHAALLLRQSNGSEYVFLSLLCQGLEIILKTALLHADYEKFSPRLQKNIGHNLKKMMKAFIKEYGIKHLDEDFEKELKQVSSFYLDSRNQDGGVLDTYVDSPEIKNEHTLRKTIQLLKIIDRKFLPKYK